jgi:hypothetical protein
VPARADGWGERVHCVGEAAEDEARAEAERGVVLLRLERDVGTVAELERHELREPRLGSPLDRRGVEVARDLDPEDAAAEALREQQRGSTAP